MGTADMRTPTQSNVFGKTESTSTAGITSFPPPVFPGYPPPADFPFHHGGHHAPQYAPSALLRQPSQEADVDFGATLTSTQDVKANTITERELGDPTEIVARRVAGMIDSFMFVFVPATYVGIIAQSLRGHPNLWNLPESTIQLSYTDLG